MEAFAFTGVEVLDATTAAAGLLAMFFVAVGAILLGYTLDEEAKGRRISWLEEPLATAAAPVPVRKVELRKAA